MDGDLFIFGGEDASRRPVSDLHVLDLASMAWREVVTTGRAPAARSAHAAVPYKVGTYRSPGTITELLLLPCASLNATVRHTARELVGLPNTVQRANRSDKTFTEPASQ